MVLLIPRLPANQRVQSKYQSENPLRSLVQEIISVTLSMLTSAAPLTGVEFVFNLFLKEIREKGAVEVRIERVMKFTIFLGVITFDLTFP